MLVGTFEDLAALASDLPAVASSAVAIIKKVKPKIGLVRAIVDDPGFLPVLDRVQQIVVIEDAKARKAQGLAPAPPPKAGEPPKSMKGGIGLKRAVPVLDGYIYVLQNPWAAYAGVAAFLGLFVGAGYMLGKRRSS
jgi:hypothetical protein